MKSCMMLLCAALTANSWQLDLALGNLQDQMCAYLNLAAAVSSKTCHTSHTARNIHTCN